jgi:murein L,D-transpeptidase YafK
MRLNAFAAVFTLTAAMTVLPACGKKQPQPAPGPARAAAAATRVRPLLEPELARNGLHLGDPVFLRAFKEERQLELFIRHRKTGKYLLFRSYPIAGVSGGPGPKLAQGDGQIPEGFYFVRPAAMKPDSTYHLAMNVGYPNAYDRHHQRTGSAIMIHGNSCSIGCLAMTDPLIEEIYTLCDAALNNGQAFFRVHLFPFRMTPPNLTKNAGHRWADFWSNLKEGYDFFETRGIPPDATVEGGRYKFGQ